MVAKVSSNVIIHCNACCSDYEMRRRDLTKTAYANDGYVPCFFCGSRNTTWDIFKNEEDEHGRK